MRGILNQFQKTKTVDWSHRFTPVLLTQISCQASTLTMGVADMTSTFQRSLSQCILDGVML